MLSGQCGVGMGWMTYDLLVGQAARSEWRATCMTRSSREKQCLAMRMAVKTARESWMDRSLTYNKHNQLTIFDNVSNGLVNISSLNLAPRAQRSRHYTARRSTYPLPEQNTGNIFSPGTIPNWNRLSDSVVSALSFLQSQHYWPLHKTVNKTSTPSFPYPCCIIPFICPTPPPPPPPPPTFWLD